MSDDELEGKDSLDEVDSQISALRKDLADTPLGELNNLKDKIGLNVYNKVLFGANNNTSSSCKKKKFSRANKNRPTETSSKVPVPRFKEVFSQKKTIKRDPRFDDLSGTFNEEYFRKSYSFITELKEKEIKSLHKQLSKEKNIEKKAKIKQLIAKMEQRQKVDSEKQVQTEKKREWKKSEVEQVKQGKKPFYLKQADKKQLDLAEKFRQLKETGKLELYMKKKRKKNASKDRKKLPSSFK